MAGRNFSTIEYLNRRVGDMKPALAARTSDVKEWRAWGREAMRRIRLLLGEFPPDAPLEPEIVERTDVGSYVREKVIFDSSPGTSVPAYVLVPKGERYGLPAILCLHGHGNGKDDVAGITHGDENRERHIRAHNYDYAHQFAERGYLTLTFDYRCFGERSEPYPSRDQCNVHFIRGSIQGVNLLTLHIHDTRRALDYLMTRPEVDEQRIGCLGLSFGGTMTMWISALDKRIRAACISCYLSEFRTFAVQMGNFCGSQFVPGLYRYFDIADIAALIAPAPLLIESGRQDPGFPFESSSRAFHRLEKVYDILGERDRLEWDAFDGGHQFSGRKAFAFFDKWLKERG